MTTRCAVLLAATLALAGCAQQKPNTPAEYEARAAYRASQFKACMELLPKGPDQTVYNDWAEVVDGCDDFARTQTMYRDGDYR